jgi:protein O-GlcNAc transferase
MLPEFGFVEMSSMMFSSTDDDLRDEAYRRYQAGDAAAATRLCHRLLERQPRSSEAVYLLGVIAQDAGQMEVAAQRFNQAVVLAPDNAVIHNALGELYFVLGRYPEALLCYRRAIVLRPTYERALNSLGRLLHAQGDLTGARASFAEALRLNPRYPTACNNLGAALHADGELDEAAKHFQQAIELQPGYPEAHFNLGTVKQAKGDPVTAAFHYREAIRLRPPYARAHFLLGQVLEQTRHDHSALACYQEAAKLLPRDAEVYGRLGNLLLLKKDWPEALAALEYAVTLQPKQAGPFARLCLARQQVCEWRSFEADLARLWDDVEKDVSAGEVSAVVPYQALTLPWSRSRQLAVARSHCEAVVRHQRASGQRLIRRHSRLRDGRLRVGYLSGDFYDHPISHLLYGMFGRHDRTELEAFAYSFGPPNQSIYRQRIVAECEHFLEVGDLSTEALVQRVADDDIHILVDLMGHTGVNRLSALALRPAPIQVSFLGMLGTTGADFMDYLITDRIVTPPEFAVDFTERFVTMPHCYLIAEAEPTVPEKPASRARYGLPETGFVYCSFNAAYKIEPRIFDVWMRILTQVPQSVLWMYSTGSLYEDNLRREANQRGVSPQRLIFAPFVPRTEHLERHRAADLFLDTLIYNAAATASLALQTGLPVLSCLGDTFASRVGASIVNAAGLPELIAADVEDYERLAIALARQPDELQKLSAKLLSGRASAPLFDTRRFVRNLELAYKTMWEIHASGGVPRPIEVVEQVG